MDEEEKEAVEELKKYPDVVLRSFKLCSKTAKSNKNVPLQKIFNP